MDSLIAKNWKNKQRQLPAANLIAYPDGTVTMLSCYSVYDPNTEERELFCSPTCDTTIESLVKYSDDCCWTPVDAWTSITYKDGKIYGGEGAMGNEGFIAHVDEGDNLIWAMFFGNTNPIKALEISGSTLIAINEHSELRLEINLENLTDIKMIAASNKYFYF